MLPLFVIGIDPGSLQSGLVTFDGSRVTGSVLPNAEIRQRLRDGLGGEYVLLAVEMLASYGGFTGMAARDVIATAVEIGRFIETWAGHGIGPTKLIPRLAVKQHLCGTSKAKDADIRLALVDRFGGVGIADKKGGRLYGVKSHAWSALAVACTAWDEAVRP